LDTIVGLAGA
jgi:hypothetical protein